MLQDKYNPLVALAPEPPLRGTNPGEWSLAEVQILKNYTTARTQLLFTGGYIGDSTRSWRFFSVVEADRATVPSRHSGCSW